MIKITSITREYSSKVLGVNLTFKYHYKKIGFKKWLLDVYVKPACLECYQDCLCSETVTTRPTDKDTKLFHSKVALKKYHDARLSDWQKRMLSYMMDRS